MALGQGQEDRVSGMHKPVPGPRVSSREEAMVSAMGWRQSTLQALKVFEFEGFYLSDKISR